MCSFGPDTVFALYTDDERPRETVGPRHDLEKSVYGIGLGVFSYSIVFMLRLYRNASYLLD